ncbi:hypothetical protein NLJ89_g9453 [Agrocybe chaxingu]|uniref:Uncharacterized protein n=1 Tax=Agrocybe chaxingu TaxID=84603 RepID=A0A9W8JT93_9AGAR|nr:hypothetical protein NLJ89_g9453 [Agrocybe chaxingu]
MPTDLPIAGGCRDAGVPPNAASASESPMNANKKSLPSGSDDAVLHKLSSIEAGLEKTDLKQLITSAHLVFCVPPTPTSRPMIQPIDELLRLQDSVAANSSVLLHERWLDSAMDLTEELQAFTSQAVVGQASTLHAKLIKQKESLRIQKMLEWEKLRMASLRLSDRARWVNSVTYVSKPLKHMHPVLVLCYVFLAYMHLICAVSLKDCRFILITLRKLLQLMAVSQGVLNPHRFENSLSHTPETILARMDLRPPTHSFICYIEQLLDRNVLSSHPGQEGLWDILDAPELREFLGPEGDPARPFLKRPGSEGRLVFSLNMDGFNPYMNKESGKKTTVGAIYLVCLNLPPAIRYDIENVFLAGIIPGPTEPSKEQINHILCPLVDDLLILWLHGFFLTSTAGYPHGRLVRGAVIPLICDLPAARQMSGFAGHSSNNFCSFCTLKAQDIDNLDYESWTSRSANERRVLAEEWRDAGSEKERDELYESTGIRWSELLRLPYWDPTRFVMIDSMHGFLLRMFQRHCRQPSELEMEEGRQALQTGSESVLRSLKAHVLRELARETGSIPYGGRPKKLLKDLLQYRITRGWFDEDGNVKDAPADKIPGMTMAEEGSSKEAQLKKRHLKSDPATENEIAIGIKVLETGSKSKLRSIRRNVLVHLCNLKGILVQPDWKVPNILTALEGWRLAAGIVDNSGNLVNRINEVSGKGKSKGTIILGRETLKEVRIDMDRLVLPSWVSAAPRNPGDAKTGKFTADQWRTFCTINLSLTLNRLWGSEPEGSRKRLMLDNFMHLVTAIKLASMHCVTQDRISHYIFHMHRYLEGLKILTNMKFGQLEKTILERFCMGQKLRSLLVIDQLPPDLEDLLQEWSAISDVDIRGTLLSDAFTYDEFYREMDQDETWTSKDLEQIPPAWYTLLKGWVSRNDPIVDLLSLPAVAIRRKSIKRLGERFQTENASPRDSHVYYGKNGTISAGTIQAIFSHTRASGDGDRTQTFFIVRPYRPLPFEFGKSDPYRRFPEVGGRMYCDIYEEEIIINDEELLYHFALSPLQIPSIPVPCIVALPLGRS